MITHTNYLQSEWEQIMANWDIELDEDNTTEAARTEVQRESLLNKLKCWATDHSIAHTAIRDILKTLNEEIPNLDLPIDGRTLMETDRNIKKQLLPLSGGLYWNYGVEKALLNALTHQNINANMTIQLKINIDSLPLFKSSSIEF